MDKKDIIYMSAENNIEDAWYQMDEMLDGFSNQDIEQEGEPTRDFTKISDNDKTLVALRKKIRVEDVMQYLPIKVLIKDKVYATKLVSVNGTYLISFTCKLDEVVRDGNLVNLEGETISGDFPDITYKFLKEDTAYVLRQILYDLIDGNAIEISNNSTMEGNINIYNNLNIINDELKSSIV